MLVKSKGQDAKSSGTEKGEQKKLSKTTAPEPTEKINP